MSAEKEAEQVDGSADPALLQAEGRKTPSAGQRTSTAGSVLEQKGGSRPRKVRKAHQSETAPGGEASSELALAAAGAYHVALPTFAGPLDLLLHLIQQHELDIKDIPIAFISQKYFEYITLMQDLNIDLASEYLVMAATLAHIKSKMLLPKPPADQDDDSADEQDPRGELVRRLLEYQKYKHAAENLGENPVLGRDVFVRGAPAPSVDGPAPLAQVSVFKLFDAFQRLLSRVKQTAEHLIDVDRISISERILELTDILRDKGQTRFEELFDEESTRADLIVTFLALLEMTRLRMMQVIQEGPLSPIYVLLTLAQEHEEVLQRDLSLGDPLAQLARGEGTGTSTADQPPEEPGQTLSFSPTEDASEQGVPRAEESQREEVDAPAPDLETAWGGAKSPVGDV